MTICILRTNGLYYVIHHGKRLAGFPRLHDAMEAAWEMRA